MDTIDKQNALALHGGAQWPTPADLQEAADELADERVNQALRWDECRAEVYRLRDLVDRDLSIRGQLMPNLPFLISALNELEKLEKGGVC